MKNFINALKEENKKEPRKRVWSLEIEDGDVSVKCGLEGKDEYHIITFYENGSIIKHGGISKTLGLNLNVLREIIVD